MTVTCVITSANEVMFSSAFVCLFVCKQDWGKTVQPILTKICGKVAHDPRKKPLDFGVNLDHVTLVLGCGYGYR